MDLQIVWFILWGILWAVYFMLDGFVLGSGMLHGILGRGETDRRRLIRAAGPVWDGNEVWLLTAGGATFAAFPGTYAIMFSALYTPLLILLFALIIRGMAMEMRNKVDAPAWKAWWDRGIVAGSFVPALLFGVAFGNIFRGLPLDAAGSHVTFLGLLNPYGLVTGILFVVLFAMHGSLWAAVKTDGDLKMRALKLAGTVWWDVLAMSVTFLGVTALWTELYDNYLAAPLLFALPLSAVGALVAVKVMLALGRNLAAFAASCFFVVLFTATGVTGLFPNLIPSILDPAFSLTIRNSSSSPYTLGIMTAVALVFVPIVIAYKIWVYRVFRAPVTEAEVEEAVY